MDETKLVFATASLDHDRYPRINSHYLAGDPSLVNCYLLVISELLYIEDTCQQSLGILTVVPRVTVKCISYVTISSPPINHNQTFPGPLTDTGTPTDHSPSIGFP